MFKSSGQSWSRPSKSAGAITVIESRVHRSSRRHARLAFVLTLAIVGLLSATIIADSIHPILALFVGVALGAVAGAIAWALVRIWPVIRLLWWWTPEILLALAVIYGFTALAHHTTVVVRLLILAAIVGLPAAIPWTRRHIVALAWCLIVRHRLRACFANFIVTNASGSLPLILWARPTPAGERVWIWLRPGLSKRDLEMRLERIAAACWASTATVDRASETNAAYLRLDIRRRNVLTDTIASPLVDLVDPDTPTVARATASVPTALDLPDVAAPAPSPAPTRAEPARKPAPTSPAPAATASGGEDVSDWI